MTATTRLARTPLRQRAAPPTIPAMPAGVAMSPERNCGVPGPKYANSIAPLAPITAAVTSRSTAMIRIVAIYYDISFSDAMWPPYLLFQSFTMISKW